MCVDAISSSNLSGVKEWVLIGSALTVVIGWFVNSLLQRKHEIAKQRMEFRLEMLHSFIPVWTSFTQNSLGAPFVDDLDLSDKFVDSIQKFQLYGFQDEINLMQKFKLSVEENDAIKATKNINTLMNLIRKRIRVELKIE